MRTTLEIPAKLLADAKRLSGAKTMNRAVLTAVEDFVRRKKIEKLFDRAEAGEFRFDNVDLDSLRHESPADGYRGSLKGIRVSKIREKKDRI